MVSTARTHMHGTAWTCASLANHICANCTPNETPPHRGVHHVGHAKLLAGLQDDGRDGRVVRVADGGEQVVHHLRKQYHLF